MCDHDTIKEQREYAWNYFQLHASQRMSSFNFFVVIAALLTTAMGATFKSDYTHHWIGITMGLSLSIISYVFWKLDQRTRYLIHHAEAALKALETDWKKDDACPHVALFSSEEERTSHLQSKSSPFPSEWHLSYTSCLSTVHFVFAFLGIIGTIGSIVLEMI